MQAKSGQYLAFMMDGQSYGVPIGTVREINRLSSITTVPQTARFISGVINLRGKVIPVVDLRLRLGIAEAKHTKQTCVIVIEGESGQIGMIVDAVTGVIDLSSEQIEPAPVMGNEADLSYVMGMAKSDQQVIILLAIVDCLSKKYLGTGMSQEALEQAAAAAAA